MCSLRAIVYFVLFIFMIWMLINTVFYDEYYLLSSSLNSPTVLKRWANFETSKTSECIFRYSPLWGNVFGNCVPKSLQSSSIRSISSTILYLPYFSNIVFNSMLWIIWWDWQILVIYIAGQWAHHKIGATLMHWLVNNMVVEINLKWRL